MTTKTKSKEKDKSTPAPEPRLKCRVLVNGAHLGGGIAARGKIINLPQAQAEQAAGLEPPLVEILGVVNN